MKKLGHLSLLCSLTVFLAACSTQVKESDLSNKAARSKKGSVLNYSLTDLKEIDLTKDASEESDAENVWQRLTNGFQFKHESSSRIQREVDFYRARPKTLPEVFTRAKPYLYMIVEEIEKRQMPMEIALLPVIESSFHTRALSSANAAGMWQFTPDTAQVRGIKNNWWFDGRKDVYLSTNAALDYLQNLHDRFDGNWLHALAAYNAGAITVRKAIERNKAKNKPTDYWYLDLPGETQRYVPKLLAVARMVESPDEYNLALPNIPNTPYLTRIEVDQQIDLSTAAQMANMSWDEFYRFNAGHKRLATDPNGKTHLMVPVDKLQTFAVNLTHFALNTNGNWISHTCSVNDNLTDLAQQYGTTPELIMQINKLSPSQPLKAGQSLLIACGVNSLDDQSLAHASAVASNTSAFELKEQTNRVVLADRKAVNTSQNSKDHHIYHKLKSNQTLAWLAQHYGVSLIRLASVNNITTSTHLRIGQPLIIPVKKVISHTAKKGDTWTSLAKRNGIPAYLLAEFNDANEKTPIKNGQVIRIPLLG